MQRLKESDQTVLDSFEGLLFANKEVLFFHFLVWTMNNLLHAFVCLFVYYALMPPVCGLSLSSIKLCSKKKKKKKKTLTLFH